MHSDTPAETVVDETLAPRKPWVTPTVQDQSIQSLTEGAKFGFPNETTFSAGPAS
ncbi:hypothetical protein LZ023_32525 [Pseudomonas silvicola]|nr:hypothetical protein LZ023_32525 [Pseudomonas silvicola]